MGRIGITFEDVEKAIAGLQSCQKNATVDNVRAILGTGSKSTIARFLREWKAKRGLQSDDDGRLPSELLAIVNGLWDALRSKADAEIAEYRREHDARMADTQQQLAQASQIEASLRGNIHTLEEKFHQQTEELQKSRAELMAENQEKIRMTERAAALEAIRHEKHAENQRLHQLLKHVQENLEHYQAATEQLRQEQSLLAEKQRNEHEQRLADLRAQIGAESREKSAYQAQYNQLKQIHESLTIEYRAIATQRSEMQGQYESLKILHEKIQHEHDILKNNNQLQDINLSELQKKIAELEFNIKSRDKRIAYLENEATRANEKIENLRHEGQFIRQEKACLEGQLRQIQAMKLARKESPEIQEFD